MKGGKRTPKPKLSDKKVEIFNEDGTLDQSSTAGVRCFSRIFRETMDVMYDHLDHTLSDEDAQRWMDLYKEMDITEFGKRAQSEILPFALQKGAGYIYAIAQLPGYLERRLNPEKFKDQTE